MKREMNRLPCKSKKAHNGPRRAFRERVRQKRDYRAQQLYAITQRGNNGQWVYRDNEGFWPTPSAMSSLPGTSECSMPLTANSLRTFEHLLIPFEDLRNGSE